MYIQNSNIVICKSPFVLFSFLFSFFSSSLSAQSITFNNTNTGATGTIQTWTVPPCVTSITIETWGAQGGGGDAGPGGLGARMKGDFTVTPGQVLKILVGQMGTQCGSEGGGGGGTFVTDNLNNPIIIAGGGGGSAGGSVGSGGDAGSCGLDGNGTIVSAGGCAGNGGGSIADASSGGGLLTDGGNSGNYSCSNTNGSGKSFVNGGFGGTGTCLNCNGTSADGGFGGGGGTHGYAIGGAGGGGYSGGGGGVNGNEGGGGGGGSYNNGTNQSNTSAEHAGHGLVQINWNTNIYNYTGAVQTFTVPANITAITVEVWGAGGGGYSGGGGGGAGGGYGKEVLAVTPGSVYNVVVGQGGVHNVGDNDSCRAASGGPSDFGTGLVVATGGEGGRKSDSNPCSAPGIAAGGSSTATVNVNGGTGASAPSSQCCPGMGGNGGGPGGGLGGAPDMPGNFPGGGAGGGTNNVLAKDGADGFIKVTWAYDTVKLTGDILICYGEYATLTASGGVSYQWSTGDTGSVIAVSPASTSTYTLIATNNGGCTDTLTWNVTVNPMPVANYTQNNVCFGAEMNFSDLSYVSPPATISSYEWNFGDNAVFSTLASPVHTYASAGIFNVTFVAATAYCSDTITSQVAVYDAPAVDFTATNTCLGDSTGFINTTAPPVVNGIANWVWDFGDGTFPDAGSWSPLHLYAFPGNYQVTLIVNSTYGCADTLSANTVVYSLPIANFSFEEVCLNQTTNFNDLSSVTGAVISFWDWDFNDNSPGNTTQHPGHLYNNAGIYAVSLAVTDNNGCTDTVIKNGTVHALPQSGFIAENVCAGSFAQFNDQSVISSPDIIQAWTWEFNDGTSVSNQSTSHLFPLAGSYSVQLTTVSGFGCVDSIVKTVVVNPIPTVYFSGNPVAGCEPLCVSFSDSSFVTGGTNAQWIWNIGDGGSSVNSQTFEHCYTTDSVSAANLFNVSLTVISDSGCANTATKTNYITVYPLPVADFTAQPETGIITNPVISITDLSVGATTWAWNFGDSVTFAQSNPPPHTYLDTGTYLITLLVSTQYNCRDTAYQTVTIEPDFVFYIPNAFTPNDDRINDSFTGKGISIKEFEMLIFDRWGNLIYKTNSIDMPWNGKANNGNELAQSDVYVYAVTVTDFKDEKHKYKGIVTLVR